MRFWKQWFALLLGGPNFGIGMALGTKRIAHTKLKVLGANCIFVLGRTGPPWSPFPKSSVFPFSGSWTEQLSRLHVSFVFASKRGYIKHQGFTLRSSSRAWTKSGPEPSHVIVRDSALTKFARQWLTLLYERSTFTKKILLESLKINLISSIRCMSEERSCILDVTAKIIPEQSDSIRIGFSDI